MEANHLNPCDFSPIIVNRLVSRRDIFTRNWSPNLTYCTVVFTLIDWNNRSNGAGIFIAASPSENIAIPPRQINFTLRTRCSRSKEIPRRARRARSRESSIGDLWKEPVGGTKYLRSLRMVASIIWTVGGDDKPERTAPKAINFIVYQGKRAASPRAQYSYFGWDPDVKMNERTDVVTLRHARKLARRTRADRNKAPAKEVRLRVSSICNNFE